MAAEAQALVRRGDTSVQEAVRHVWDAELGAGEGDA
jgi:hypothetical protein